MTDLQNYLLERMGGEPPDVDPLEREVERLWRQEEARRIVLSRKAEKQFRMPEFFGNLEEELDAPEPEIKWTIKGLHEIGFNSSIVAKKKTGKTTLAANLITSLADREPFLGHFETRELNGRIAYFNYETTREYMTRVFRSTGIKNTKKVVHLALRGNRLALVSDYVCEQVVKLLKDQDIEVWIMDPFGRAMRGSGDQNSNTDASEFLGRIDQIKAEAGVKDFFLPLHAGHQDDERARGASELGDWPDSIWVIRRGTDDQRTFQAEGRHDPVEEHGLRFDLITKRLTYDTTAPAKTSRKAKMAALKPALIAFIASHPGCGFNDITGAVGGDEKLIKAELDELVVVSEIERRDGPRRKVLHYIAGTAP